MNHNVSQKDLLLRDVQLRLGDGIIDLEADPEHYDLAFRMAVDRYRQRSSNAMEEAYIFLEIEKDVDVYYLPPEVQMVRQVLRRGVGSGAGGNQIDPFSLAYTNNIYMLSNPGAIQPGGVSGSLATFDFAAQYQELVGRMFGREVIFAFEQSSGRLHLNRKFGAPETILLWVYNQKPVDALITNVYSRPWIRDYTVAATKMIIGEARGKFAQLAGPQGGFSLNGEALRSEGLAEMERLEAEVKTQIDGNYGYSFVIG